MKYIYFLLQEIPQLQNLLPRELWLEIGDLKIKTFQDRVSALKMWRYVIRANTPYFHQVYKVGIPKQIYHDTDDFTDIYAFEHQKYSRGPLLSWEVIYRGGNLAVINFSIYGRFCESFTEYTL